MSPSSTDFHITHADLSNILGVGQQPVDAEMIDSIYTSVRIHSSRLKSNSIFVALKGAKADGHDFIQDALNGGASLVVCERCSPELRSNPRIILVPSSKEALFAIARYWRRQLRARFILVTGTHGKTIVKSAVANFLTRCGQGTTIRNDRIGVALSILDISTNSKCWVGEAVVCGVGDGDFYSHLLEPALVVVPNLSTQWTARFASREEELAEYRALLHPASGRILSSDAEEALGIESSPEMTTVAIELGDQAYTLFWSGRSVSVETHSLEVATDVALALQAALFEASRSSLGFNYKIEVITPPESRLQQWRSPRGIMVIKDQATSDPVALWSAFDALNRLKANSSRGDQLAGRSVFIIPPPAKQADTVELLGTSRTYSSADLRRLTQSCTLHNNPPDTILCLDPDQAVDLQNLLSKKVGRPNIVGVGGVLGAREWLDLNLRYGDCVLVQASGERTIEDFGGLLFSSMAANRMYIDLDAIQANVLTFRKRCPGVALTAMVKALAYGTDPVNLSIGLQALGVDSLAVSNVDEGIRLRQAGITGTILVMLATPESVQDLIDYSLTPVVYSEDLLGACIEATTQERSMSIHLEFDTGMHRTGFDHGTAERQLKLVRDTPNLRCSGIMTHLACADSHGQDNFTSLQLDRFDGVKQKAQDLGLTGVIYHAAATAGAIRFPRARYDMVRIGLGLFGIYPSGDCEGLGFDLTPVVQLKSRIVEVGNVGPHEGIGYGITDAALETRVIAVIPAGYHDCFPRSLSGRGKVEIGGILVPIVGRVSMDSAMLDITGVDGAGVGTEVSIYGPIARIEESAKICGTIPYELLARIGPRVQRILVSNSSETLPLGVSAILGVAGNELA